MSATFRLVCTWALCFRLMAGGVIPEAVAQSPVITVRFANPQSNCGTQEYCLDVEFISDQPDQEVFGMNVRLFYDDDLLELIDFRDFQGGYGPVAPNPPSITTSEFAGPALFNFAGPADFVNGAMQLVNGGAPPILIGPDTWTKLFQICFSVDDQSAEHLDTFCPPVVWDLEQDPANGGFLTGDDGVVITILDSNGESAPSDESVDQYNWEYIGDGSPPYGQPVEIICSNVNCLLPVDLLSFTGQVLPSAHLLSWTTQFETNLKGFSIQRSAYLNDWKEIGQVEAYLQVLGVNRYEWWDKAPFPGTNYYRLMSVDLDGQKGYSRILTLKNNGNRSVEWSIFPNPVSHSRITILYTENPSGPAYFYLINSLGELAGSGLAEFSGRTAHLELGKQVSGVYSLCLQTSREFICKNIIIY